MEAHHDAGDTVHDGITYLRPQNPVLVSPNNHRSAPATLLEAQERAPRRYQQTALKIEEEVSDAALVLASCNALRGTDTTADDPNTRDRVVPLTVEPGREIRIASSRP
ncbi:hypothetical protein GCM10025734_51500 [Kitasatospora paranensis]